MVTENEVQATQEDRKNMASKRVQALFTAFALAVVITGLAAPSSLHSIDGVKEASVQPAQVANDEVAVAAEDEILSEEEFREFLRNAKVVASKQTSKGVTAPVKLTLSDGQRTLKACFQAIDEFKTRITLPSRTEFNFRDSYHFNIAGYELAKLLGLADMIPVAVEYRWKGQMGSLCWWVPAKLDEQERLKQKLQPPDVNAWNKQMNNMWVFSELIYDTDANQTNMLITDDWKLWRIDFTRAFRLQKDLFEPQHLVQCDRQLLQSLRQLDEAEVLKKTKPHLSKGQVKALMARRDKIVVYFEQLIAQKGEDRVLY